MNSHAQLDDAKLSIPGSADIIIIGLEENARILSTLPDSELFNTLAEIAEAAPAGASYECFRCGHHWQSRKPGLPKRCGNMKCQTPYWATRKERG